MSDGIWWFSYAKGDPLGIVILPHEPDELMLSALVRAHEMGISPLDAEVLGNWAPDDTWIDSGEAWVLRPEFQNRMIPLSELEAMGYSGMTKDEVRARGVEISDGDEETA